LRSFDLELEWDGFFDETLEAIVAFGEVFSGCGKVKGQVRGCHGGE
jgi:hypothetical protein